MNFVVFFGLILAVVLLFIWPQIQKGNRGSKAANLVKRAQFEPAERRLQMEKEALEMVKGDAEGLVSVAHAALLHGRKQLAERAIEQLRQTGERLEDLRRLEVLLSDDEPRALEQAVAEVTRFLDAGIPERARAELEEAEQRWPDAPELAELRERVERALQEIAAQSSSEQAS